MFRFIKKNMFKSLSCMNPLISTSLYCISMNNQEFKVTPKVINVNSRYFILLVSKQVSVVVVVIISMIHMQKCVFLML